MMNSVNSVLGLMIAVVTIILLYQYWYITLDQTVIWNCVGILFKTS